MKADKRSVLDVLYEAPGKKTQKYIRIFTVCSVIILAVLCIEVVLQFYRAGQLSSRYWSFFTKFSTWRFLGKGIWGTVKVAAVAGCITFSLGFLLMICRICRMKVLNVISSVLIAFSRGTPTLLFIYFFFLVVPQMGLKLASFWKIVLPVSISAAGVVAEVLRSGVNAVPKGQREAALSLGMQSQSVFLKIIFPQAFRFVIPALIAEIVIVLKDTTFAYVVNYADFMQNAKVLISNYDSMLSVYLIVAVIYILINSLLGKLAVWFTQREKAMTGEAITGDTIA